MKNKLLHPEKCDICLQGSDERQKGSTWSARNGSFAEVHPYEGLEPHRYGQFGSNFEIQNSIHLLYPLRITSPCNSLISYIYRNQPPALTLPETSRPRSIPSRAPITTKTPSTCQKHFKSLRTFLRSFSKMEHSFLTDAQNVRSLLGQYFIPPSSEKQRD